MLIGKTYTIAQAIVFMDMILTENDDQLTRILVVAKNETTSTLNANSS
jgi:hypothetical protein